MAKLEMTFFGNLLVTLDDRPITHFRSANNQGLLVYLALQNDRPHPREVLAALFWPDEPESVARNNLRQALYQLRRLLGDLGEPDRPFLLVSRQTVQFNPDGNYHLDVCRFLEAVETGDLAAAADLYQDELLPGFTCDSLSFEDWLRREREQLHYLAVEAMFELGEDHLQRGRYDRAQMIARRQLHLEPWRETAHQQLMRALALGGDRGSALLQFDACRAVLEEELGVVPAPETVALREEIEAGRLRPIPAAEPQRPPVKIRHNLPVDTTPFIGRELEVTELSRLLTQERQRLVTIVAPGGMGKTRLALATGKVLLESYPDGVTFVDLAPLHQAEDIKSAVAAALDYFPPDSEHPVWPQLLAWLSRRQLLLILDNFEHLIDGAALLNDLLQNCPHIDLLVTSRQRLSLSSESRYELGGLAFPARPSPTDAISFNAVRLFVDSGQRARQEFSLNEENVGDVIRICRLVEGMPLGLILAAAWLTLLTPAEIAAEIEAGLDFLAADLADLPLRQRSMQAVFAGSWQGLSPAEQAVLSRLSVFRGGFTREAAESVAGANLRILLTLLNKSLLHRTAGGRYNIHELLRQFAARRLYEAGESEQTCRAHGRYFSRLVEEEVRKSGYLYPSYVSERIAADEDNIRWAWTNAMKQGGGSELSNLAPGLVALIFDQGGHPQQVLQEAIQVVREHAVQEQEWSLLYLRLLETFVLFHFDKFASTGQLNSLISDLEAYGDPRLLFWGYNVMWLESRMKYSESVKWAQKRYESAVETGDEQWIKLSEVYLLSIDVFFDRADETTAGKLKDLLIYFERRLPGSDPIFTLLWSLSSIYRTCSDYEQAVYYGQCCLNIAKSWKNLYQITIAADKLAEIYMEIGQQDLASGQQFDALEWHLALGQEWQTLGFIHSRVAEHPELFADQETAVSILSMVYHHPESIPLFTQHIQQVLPALEAEMPPDLYQTAWEKGKTLDFETAIAHLRTALAEPHEWRESTID
ncbi:MAG: BTAD domain-containing putative transcriptional regulator [Ardenticatenaceae bacterium]|nr:BTAD domain-containing putative transcriptional regulator [Ardenticatenaceae bacterium]